MIKSTKSGFTLAEVLTTLMVIGVVAAMTIPTLLNSTGEQQARVACKKAASVLSQAVQLMVAKEVECNINKSDASQDLASCMSQVMAGSLNTTDDTITTSDGMIYKFYAATPGSDGQTLEQVCGTQFVGWKGNANCGVLVDTNGTAKGNKSFSTATFSTSGFSADPQQGTDQIAFSLSSSGVRPIVYAVANSNKTYEYMLGKAPTSDTAKDGTLCTAKSATVTECKDIANGVLVSGAYYYSSSGSCSSTYDAKTNKFAVTSCKTN